MPIQEVTGKLLERSEEANVSLYMIVGKMTHLFYVHCPVKGNAPQLFHGSVTASDTQELEVITRYMESKVILNIDGTQPEFLYIGMASVLVRLDSVVHVRKSNFDFTHR